MPEAPPFPEIPKGQCQPCPTRQSIEYGHDPESFDILMSESWCREMRDEMGELWCPWRNAGCLVHPVELDWAIACHEAGVKPPIKLHPAFTLEDTMSGVPKDEVS